MNYIFDTIIRSDIVLPSIINNIFKDYFIVYMGKEKKNNYEY